MKYLKLFKFYKNTNKDKKKKLSKFLYYSGSKKSTCFFRALLRFNLKKFLILKSTNIYVLLIIFCPNLAQYISAWWAVQYNAILGS
jgi:hypothetical protein